MAPSSAIGVWSSEISYSPCYETDQQLSIQVHIADRLQLDEPVLVSVKQSGITPGIAASCVRLHGD